MSLLEDHGGYWDNDEHFVIPLLRELDVPTGDRSASRFYSDGAESYLRSRRKERVGLLALWRRALLSLPLVAIVAAATVSMPWLRPDARKTRAAVVRARFPGTRSSARRRPGS